MILSTTITIRQVVGEEVFGGHGFIVARAECAGDEAVTGGGYRITPRQSTVEFIVFHTDRSLQNGWSVEIFNNGTSTLSLLVFAECAKLVSPP
jgi:hypothetical protein